MSTKNRGANFRRSNMRRDKGKKQVGPRSEKKNAYQANKRNTERAELRSMRWGF